MLNFDELVELHKRDPAAFEAYRATVVDEYIVKRAKSDEHVARYRAMMWRLNKDLEKYKDPYARYLAVVRHFEAQLIKFQTALNQLNVVTTEHKEIVDAKVLTFKKKE